jgi:hypothetical protein
VSILRILSPPDYPSDNADKDCSGETTLTSIWCRPFPRSEGAFSTWHLIDTYFHYDRMPEEFQTLIQEISLLYHQPPLFLPGCLHNTKIRPIRIRFFTNCYSEVMDKTLGYSKKEPWYAELKELIVCFDGFPTHREPALDFVQQLVGIELTKIDGILKCTDSPQKVQSTWNKVSAKDKGGQSWSWFQATWTEAEG